MEVEVYATGTTVSAWSDEQPIAAHLVAGAVRQLAGGETWHVVPTTSARRGGGTDIVRPVQIDPRLACELATSGALFREPVPHLAIAQRDGDDDASRYLVWDATLRTGRHRRRRVSLHLLASPSMVVTVLELVPRHRLRRHRTAYLRDGVDAIEVLAHRLELAIDRQGPAV